MAAENPTIVLVHGAWADATGFDAEIRALRDREYSVVGFGNPLRDLAGDAAYLAEFLRTLSGPIVLVGHSYGGNVISIAAIGNEQVKALVYLNGWMCDVGESQQQLLEKFEGSLVGPSIRPVPFTNPDGSEGTDLYLAQEAFHEAFAAVGISAYTNVPRAMSLNREEMTENQMLESLRSLDRQLHDAAQPLSQRHAKMVRISLEQNPFGGGIWRRLSGNYPNCATRAAQATLREETAFRPDMGDDPLEKVDALLSRKDALLGRVRRHLRLKAMLEVWLYIHVPATFALIAALVAHIISVFFYW